jgi:hypothetical protein
MRSGSSSASTLVTCTTSRTSSSAYRVGAPRRRSTTRTRVPAAPRIRRTASSTDIPRASRPSMEDLVPRAHPRPLRRRGRDGGDHHQVLAARVDLHADAAEVAARVALQQRVLLTVEVAAVRVERADHPPYGAVEQAVFAHRVDVAVLDVRQHLREHPEPAVKSREPSPTRGQAGRSSREERRRARARGTAAEVGTSRTRVACCHASRNVRALTERFASSSTRTSARSGTSVQKGSSLQGSLAAMKHESSACTDNVRPRR